MKICRQRIRKFRDWSACYGSWSLMPRSPLSRGAPQRALNVKSIEVCPSSRCPIRRPRLYWLSWKLPVVDHYSVQRAKGVDVLGPG